MRKPKAPQKRRNPLTRVQADAYTQRIREMKEAARVLSNDLWSDDHLDDDPSSLLVEVLETLSKAERYIVYQSEYHVR